MHVGAQLRLLGRTITLRKVRRRPPPFTHEEPRAPRAAGPRSQASSRRAAAPQARDEATVAWLDQQAQALRRQVAELQAALGKFRVVVASAPGAPPRVGARCQGLDAKLHAPVASGGTTNLRGLVRPQREGRSSEQIAHARRPAGPAGAVRGAQCVAANVHARAQRDEVLHLAQALRQHQCALPPLACVGGAAAELRGPQDWAVEHGRAEEAQRVQRRVSQPFHGARRSLCGLQLTPRTPERFLWLAAVFLRRRAAPRRRPTCWAACATTWWASSPASRSPPAPQAWSGAATSSSVRAEEDAAGRLCLLRCAGRGAQNTAVLAPPPRRRPGAPKRGDAGGAQRRPRSRGARPGAGP